MVNKVFELVEKPYSDEDAEWDAFVANHSHGSLLQTTNWARLKGRFGWRTYRVWLKRDGQLVAGAQILFRSWAFGLVKMGYIPHGPLVDWDDHEQVDVLLNQIDHAAYQHRAGILKMEPLLWQDSFDQDKWLALAERHELKADSDTIQPPRTLQIDLKGSEEEILSRMKQKTRYNIRLSGRKGVTTRVGDAGDLTAFIDLVTSTSTRNAFGVHDPEYYRLAYGLFAPKQCALLMAEYEGKPLAAVMAFAHQNKGIYLFGASSSLERQRMPAYAAQWAAMRWCRQQGCSTYDLWGVPDCAEEELEQLFSTRNDGLWGVYRHKRGYGGRLRRTVGSADRVLNARLYRLYQWRRRRMLRANTPGEER